MLLDPQEWKRCLKGEKGRTSNPHSNKEVIYVNNKTHYRHSSEIWDRDRINIQNIQIAQIRELNFSIVPFKDYTGATTKKSKNCVFPVV